MKSKPPMSVAAFKAEIAKNRAATKDAALSFVNSILSSDPRSFSDALEKLDYFSDGWSQALHEIAKLKNVWVWQSWKSLEPM